MAALTDRQILCCVVVEMYFFILFGACVLLFFLSYHGLVSLYNDFKKNYPVHAWFLSNPRLFISLVTTNANTSRAKKGEKKDQKQKQINAGSFQIDEDSCFEYKNSIIVPYVFKEKPYIFLTNESETSVALQKYLEEKNGLVYSIDHIQEMDISKVFGPYGTPPPDDLFFDYLDYLKISGCRMTVKRIGNDDLVYDTVMREQINE